MVSFRWHGVRGSCRVERCSCLVKLFVRAFSALSSDESECSRDYTRDISLCLESSGREKVWSTFVDASLTLRVDWPKTGSLPEGGTRQLFRFDWLPGKTLSLNFIRRWPKALVRLLLGSSRGDGRSCSLGSEVNLEFIVSIRTSCELIRLRLLNGEFRNFLIVLCFCALLDDFENQLQFLMQNMKIYCEIFGVCSTNFQMKNEQINGSLYLFQG